MLFVQLSDLHIDEAEKESVDYPNSMRLRQVVSYINRVPFKPSFVLVTGDVANGHGSETEYQIAKSLLDELTVPYYVMVGNHDSRNEIKAVFNQPYMFHKNGFVNYAIDQDDLSVLCLDTLVKGQSYGALCEERINWLSQALEERRGHEIIIAMHHPPFQSGIESMDQRRCLEGAVELRKILESHQNVRAIICGHVHRSFSTIWAGKLAHISASISPAVELRLLPNQPLSIWPEPPSCSIIGYSKERGVTIHTLPYVVGARVWEDMRKR